MMKSFVLGTLVGSAVVWFWGDRIRETIDARTDGVRNTLVGWLDIAEDVLGTIRERLDAGLTGITSPNEPGDSFRPAAGR